MTRERYADVGWRENVVCAGVTAAVAAPATSGQTLYLCTAKPTP